MNINSLYARALILLGLLMTVGTNSADISVEGAWQALIPTDGSSLTARHEAASVVVGDDIYLLGGRSNRPVERFSVSTGQWENLGAAPLEIHHMQPVVLGGSIYVIGAFTCCYPREEIVTSIYVFDTENGTWDVAGSLPLDRIRGSAGAVVYEGKIYLLGGNVAGHEGGAVAWFDEFDPKTGIWQALPDAPNARDHFSAVMVGDQLIAAAGRQTSTPSPASNPVLATDIFDFKTRQWRSGAAIPTPRAGVVSVAYDGHVIVAGGEINTSAVALDAVEAYDVETNAWQALPSMSSGRHGSGGGIVGSYFYMLSGAPTIGGASELTHGERLELLDIEIPVIVTPKLSSQGGSAGLLLLVGLMCVGVFRHTGQQYGCTDS